MRAVAAKLFFVFSWFVCSSSCCPALLFVLLEGRAEQGPKDEPECFGSQQLKVVSVAAEARRPHLYRPKLHPQQISSFYLSV